MYLQLQSKLFNPHRKLDLLAKFTNFQLLQQTNQTRTIEIAQHNKYYVWFLQIQHKMPLLVTTAVSKSFNPLNRIPYKSTNLQIRCYLNVYIL